MKPRRFTAGIGLLTMVLTSSACMKTSVAIQPVPGTINTENATKTEKAQFFLWGLVGEKTIDLSKVCPNGVHWAQTQATVVDSLLGFITIGIYSPRTVAMKCSSGSAYLLEPVEDANLTIVTMLDADELATIEAAQ